MPTIRFSKSPQFKRRKDATGPDEHMLATGSGVSISYEVMKDRRRIIAGYDSSRGAWIVALMKGAEGYELAGPDDLSPDEEWLFSDIEILP